jgi:hypothetical protein
MTDLHTLSASGKLKFSGGMTQGILLSATRMVALREQGPDAEKKWGENA